MDHALNAIKPIYCNKILFTRFQEIFERVVKENLKKLPDGHSYTLLAYGASGSGKTYTLMGTVNSPGLIPRSLEYVFKLVNASQQPMYKPTGGESEKLEYNQQEFELQVQRQNDIIKSLARLL